MLKFEKDMAAGLLEKDQVDVKKTEKIFEDCAELVEGCWEKILEEVTIEVKGNL